MDADQKVPRDEFSSTLRSLESHPEAVIKTSIVQQSDFYGNVITWVVRTARHDGKTTVLLERGRADGGDRFVLPPDVVAAISRQHEAAVAVNRRRGARKGAATREAKGIRPAFLKGRK